jgi:putative salt-induced outer membrane protein YdiY
MSPRTLRFLFTPLLVLTLVLASSPSLWAQAADDLSKAKATQTSYAEDIDLTKNQFKSETKIGAVFTTGNTESLLVDGSSYTLWRIKRWENKWRLGVLFNKVTENVGSPSSVGTIANYIYGFYRLDYYFLPRTTVYVGGGGYVDEIKGIDLAANAFVGISHYWLRTPTYSLNTSLGYDYTHEDRVDPIPSDDIHAISVGLIYKQQFKPYLGFSQSLLGLENAQDGHDFRLNSDTELKVTLTKHLGLVIGFHLRFDNEPVPTFKKLDTITDVSLAIAFGGDAEKKAP